MFRRLLYLFFIYLVLEGALRKWMLPSLSNELFLLKDVIIIGAALDYFVNDKKRINYIESSELIIWAGWVFLVIGFFLSSNYSLSNIAGLRYYLILLPILYLFPAAISNFSQFNNLARGYLYLTIVVCVFGFIQFFSPMDSLINAYAWKSTEFGVATFGGTAEVNRARITGTFSYITPHTYFMQFMFFVAWAFFISGQENKDKVVGLISLCLILSNIIMSGSRAPFFIAVVFSLPFLYLLLTIRKGQKSIGSIVLLVLTFGGGSVYLFSEALELLSERNVIAGDSEGRIVGALLTPFYTLEDAEFLGAGVGASFLGLGEVSGNGGAVYTFDEVNNDRMGIELGYVGYLYIIFVKLVFMIKTFELFRKTAIKNIKTWALVSLCFQASLLWKIPVYQTVAFAFYLLSLGLFFWLRHQNNQLRMKGYAN